MSIPEIEKQNEREVYKFRLVTRLGETMLKNGGEIFRADEAMHYAADAFGLRDFCSYVIANGMFSSFCSEGQMYSCKILSLPLTPIVLRKVEALNELSRKIATQGCTPEEVEQALDELRTFMFENVYRNPVAKGEEVKAKAMLGLLYEYYYAHPEMIPEDFQPQLSFDGMEQTVCDYIAGMTDNYAVDKYTELFIPMGWNVR